MAETALHVDRKRLGAFYTESDTAKAIAHIAVGRSDATILDPCFGGCAFLEAVRGRLVALGNRRPMERVFGVDVDPCALRYLQAVRGARPKQFLVRDFLDTEPDAFRSAFDVVLGNPPFIRHHLMSDDAVARAQTNLVQDFKVPKTADSWLYFFHHSLRFLKHGGCLAMVLPGSLLNADYASSARQVLASQFASCDMFLVRRRLFADALESPVIVIARGFKETPRISRMSIVDSPDEIGEAVGNGAGSPVDLSGASGPWRLALVTDATRDALATLTHHPAVAQFGSIAKIHIGVVTGANQFFALTDDEVAEHRLPAAVLRPVLSTSKQFDGLALTAAQLRGLRRRGERALLLDTNQCRIGVRIAAYLDSTTGVEARHTFKCRDREVWHRLEDLEVSDAFLSYVIDRVPRLVLNTARALCTNAIHRVWWRQKVDRTAREGWALSMVSSLGGLSAELYGRVAGGGALKLEPSAAAALWVPIEFHGRKKVSAAFAAASKALAEGNWELARNVADRAILRDELGVAAEGVAALRSGHDALLGLRFSLAARTSKRAV